MNFLDIIFPENCLGCGKSGGYLCKNCISQVPYASTMCPICLRFSYYGKTHDTCKTEGSLDGLFAIWEYSGVIRKSISEVKYKFAYAVGPAVTNSALIEIKKFKLFERCTIVSVPLYKTRKNWRGFNQSDLYAQNIARSVHWSFYKSLLVRTENTTPQVMLPKKKRLRNIRGKIAVNTTVLEQIDKNLPLFIFDDVWTTGATLKECARVIKQFGIKEVWGLTLARA